MNCKSLHKRFREIYPWRSISPTFHFLIAHGSEVLRYFGGSTGATTEESQEKMNKEFRGARQYHERKNSRLNNFIDIARWLLQKSDPVLY